MFLGKEEMNNAESGESLNIEKNLKISLKININDFSSKSIHLPHICVHVMKLKKKIEIFRVEACLLI